MVIRKALNIGLCRIHGEINGVSKVLPKSSLILMSIKPTTLLASLIQRLRVVTPVSKSS